MFWGQIMKFQKLGGQITKKGKLKDRNHELKPVIIFPKRAKRPLPSFFADGKSENSRLAIPNQKQQSHKALSNTIQFEFIQRET